MMFYIWNGIIANHVNKLFIMFVIINKNDQNNTDTGVTIRPHLIEPFLFSKIYIKLRNQNKNKQTEKKKTKQNEIGIRTWPPRQLANGTMNSWGTLIVDSLLFIDSFVRLTLNFLCHKFIGRNVIYKNIKYSEKSCSFIDVELCAKKKQTNE